MPFQLELGHRLALGFFPPVQIATHTPFMVPNDWYPSVVSHTQTHKSFVCVKCCAQGDKEDSQKNAEAGRLEGGEAGT